MLTLLRRLVPSADPRVLLLHLVALSGLMGVHIGLQRVLWRWTIEDAAISYAFARHLVAGEGLVAVPGGERVEGYSNPLWVACLAAGEVIGADPFAFAKLLGMALGAATVALVWALSWRARGRLDAVPLVGAALFATQAQAVIWSASGLENSLWSALLAAGLLLGLAEAEERERWPLSSLAFLGLALTRPEGLLYAGLAGVGLTLAVWRRRRWGALSYASRWLALFFGPFVLYHALRYEYFAWPLPNTYYAKLEDRELQLGRWMGEGWRYLRSFAWSSRHGWLLPLYALALVPPRRRLAEGLLWAVFTAFAVAMLLQALPGTPLAWAALTWPKSLAWARVGGVSILAVAYAAGASLRRESVAVSLSGWLMLAGLFFALYSGGDWMKGYRWLSLVAVPGTVLLALGLGGVADLLVGLAQRRALPPVVRWGVQGVVFAVVAVVLVPSVREVFAYSRNPETGPYAIKERVDYNRYVLEHLDVDRAWGLDVDMGANMYWGDWRLVDMAGLVDVPIAHHDYQPDFVKSYLFRERRPDFCHVHGRWADRTLFRTYAEWDQLYIELPGYPVGARTMHTGNFVRRDHLFADHWSGEGGRELRYASGVRVLGWTLLEPEVAPGQALRIEVGLATPPREEGDDIHLILFLGGQEREVLAQLTPTSDWIPVQSWPEGVVHRLVAAVELPGDLPLGDYDLGMALLTRTGFDTPVLAPSGTERDAPRVAEGEVRWPGEIRVVSADERHARDEALVEELVSAATSGDCEGAETSWRHLRAATATRSEYREQLRARVRAHVAGCYATRAVERDAPARVSDLALAQRWDHRDARYLAQADGVARELVERGHGAARSQDWRLATQLFLSAVQVQPTHAWARRWAEEARDRRDGMTAADRQREKLAQVRSFDAALAKHGVAEAPSDIAESSSGEPSGGEAAPWPWSGQRGGLPWGALGGGLALWGALLLAGRRLRGAD